MSTNNKFSSSGAGSNQPAPAIHRFRLGGYNIIIDKESGSVHSADEAAYAAAGLIEAGVPRVRLADALRDEQPQMSAEEAGETTAEIGALIDEGTLFSKPIDAAGASFSESGQPAPKLVKALCLHVSHACNLTCSYCFAGGGGFGGPAALMSAETGKRALDFLMENSGAVKNLEVDFFGGEPLVNFEAVREITSYGRELEKRTGKNLRFTLTTNGLALNDDIIDFMNREMHNVVLSLDGRRETHDRFRVTTDGRGSFDTVLPLFRKLVERRGGRDYYIRATFTRHNLDFAADVLHMADLGFKKLSAEPVVAPEESPAAIRKEDLPVLFEQYEHLASEMLRRTSQGRGFEFYHYKLDLESGPCLHKRHLGCGAGTDYLAVTPAGEFFPCHQFVGNSQFSLGNLKSGITNTEIREQFAAETLNCKPGCADCFARLFCAGGCSANSFAASGETAGKYDIGCELFKKRLECAIMMQVAAAAEGIEL